MGLYGPSALKERQGISTTVRVPYRGCHTAQLIYDSCTFRAEPIHKGDKVVPPASFPTELPPDTKMIPDELPIVSDEVLGEVCLNIAPSGNLLISFPKIHALLVLAHCFRETVDSLTHMYRLEKFVAFSQVSAQRYPVGGTGLLTLSTPGASHEYSCRSRCRSCLPSVVGFVLWSRGTYV